uniref:Uncharacterized protein n=1 Tax=Prolemur simus TaxID=1328070 RepID=A0A8C8ZZ33_PROSS
YVPGISQLSAVLRLAYADQFRNATAVLQQCGSPASFNNTQTAINEDQPANPTEEYAQLFCRIDGMNSKRH